MKFKKGYIRNINKKILAGTLTVVLIASPLTGCTVEDITQEDYVIVKQAEISISGITIDQFNEGIKGGLVKSSTDEKVMKHNTKYLQNIVDKAIDNETIKLPSGKYYFYPQKSHSTQENYIIKFSGDNKNFIIEGVGNDETTNSCTILKPYGITNSGIHMFYFNDYRESNFKSSKYLVGITFKNFIIDGISTVGNSYNSEGKGFMINLYKDCHWSYVTVKNTWGTGFGMDCPINSSLDNCVAINCGRGAYTRDIVESAPGASGFGIGTGFSENESIKITNCTSIGNAKFGFFFENQSRFNSESYKAKKGFFEVENCMSIGNLYNYGGLRAYNVIYRDSTGIITDYTTFNVYFCDESKRNKLDNITTEVETNKILVNKK